MIPLGILAAAGAGPLGSYDLLATTILSSSQASVSFQNLNNFAADYQHLQLRAVVRTNRGTFANDELAMRFNADSAGNYSWHRLEGTGSSVGSSPSANATFVQAGITSASGAVANNFSAIVTDILDPFETTKFKTTRSLAGFTGGAIQLMSGNWRNTGAITTIALTPLLGTNFIAGSRFSLYGIRKVA